MNLKLFVGAAAVATVLGMPAMAEVGCEPGNSLYMTMQSNCQMRLDDRIYGVRSGTVIAAPEAYAYVPQTHVYSSGVYAYDPHYPYDPHMRGVGFHAGPVGVSVWGR